MKRIGIALAVAALAVPAAPVAADPVAPAPAFPEPPSSQKRHAVASDETVAIVLGGVLLFVVVAAPLFGAESRPGWRNVNRKPTFRMVGSMRPEDWPPTEFKR
jgi:hypothetical protein